MKNLFLFSFLFIALLGFSSCGDDDGGGDGDDNPTGAFMTCKIDGADFEAMPITVGGTTAGSSLSLQGNTGGLDARTITFSLIGSYNGPGTYNFGTSFLSNTATYIDEITNIANQYVSAQAGADVGSITVTLDVGVMVEGTFEFNAARQMDNSQTTSITNGEFRLILP